MYPDPYVQQNDPNLQQTAKEPRESEQWTACERCGEPLRIDPDTGQPEPCASCRTSSSFLAMASGVGLIAIGIALVVALVAISIAILL